MSSAALETSIYTALNVAGVLAAAPGGVHRRKAPQGSGDATIVIFTFDSADDVKTLAGPAWLDSEFTVRAVCAGLSTAPADTAYGACHALLEGATLTIPGFSPMYCRRRTLVSYDEDAEGGKTYQHVGGTYRVMAT